VTSVVGLLLAAGEGRRFGGPKALARDDDGTSWLLRAVQALRPCSEVVVVLGAEAERAAALLPMSVSRIRADDWAEGMGASLRAGLEALAPTDHDAAVVSLVDLPDVDDAVVARLLDASRGRDHLARASYDGVPGHPVLLGRDHWAGVVASATGDRGARDYLAAHDVDLVECGDLATGSDVDRR
jgi:nicotine blue oxidoreductase